MFYLPKAALDKMKITNIEGFLSGSQIELHGAIPARDFDLELTVLQLLSKP